MRIGLTGWNILPKPAMLPSPRPFRLLAETYPITGHRRLTSGVKLRTGQPQWTSGDSNFTPRIQTYGKEQ